MAKRFLAKGNGHQIANRRKALEVASRELPEICVVDERTVEFEPHGVCHFAAYTDDNGAMISTPGRDDNAFGSADWHARDNLMMVYDPGDGRCMIFVCPIGPLFERRTIGHHGVRWNDVRKLAKFTHVFRIE
ncbi:hypothetical protein [Caulobacter sp. BK020]|uniref:hypothetical protein n=1 Tax=Caulobacter sp. BK020 TaxID=2512117 RepID=UPI001045BF3F|nr:hypothetical protein [Caulobacter sp. BK020]TCS12589.1 hypothetical protein EV278_11210 [Caulobacter sp. BK020]